MMQSAPTARRRAPALAAALCAASSLVLSCSSARTQDLVRLSQREETRQDLRAVAAPPPPGVDTESIQPIDSGNAVAFVDLDEAITLLSGKSTTEEIAPAEPPIGNDRALRLYVSGRSKRLSGDLTGAIEDLRAAQRLESGSSALWRELGEAQLDAGDRLSAVAAFREALRIDPDDLRALVIVGLAAEDRRDSAAAAELLARAWTLLQGADAALPHVVGAALGRALLAEGYVRAGAEALRVAADLPPTFDQPTAYGPQLTDVYRAQAELWRDIGDASARLGDYGVAIASYLNASQHPTFNPGSLMPRLVYVSMRSGRPATAARFVVGNIEALDWRADDRHIRLIRHINRYSDAGPAIAQALLRAEEELPEDRRRLAEGSLIRARAAALPLSRAVALLRERIERRPGDEETVFALFERLAEEEPSSLAFQAAALIEIAPMQELLYTRSLLRVEPGVETLLAATEGADWLADYPAGASLLRARLLLTMARPDEAALTLAEAEIPDGAVPAATALLAESLIADGRSSEAVDALVSLPDDPDSQRARSRVYEAMGRYDASLDALRPLVDAPDARAEDLLIAGQICSLLEQYDAADAFFQRAIASDPMDEQAYAARLLLYTAGGPLADRDIFGDLLAQLRAIAPSSRTIRWLRAQELVAAGQYGEAERELLSLAEEQPTPAITSLLTTVWMRTGSADRAERWLRQKRAERPNDPLFVEQLARVLAATDRGDEAATLLREALASRPSENSLSRALETILRDRLNRPIEADDLALERLRRTPESIGRSIELSGVLLRRDEHEAATVTLMDGLSLGDPIRERQAEAIVQATYLIADRAVNTDSNVTGASDLVDRVASIIRPLPIALHERRMDLLIRTNTDVSLIISSINRALEEAPNEAPILYGRAGQLLEDRDRPKDALAVLEAGALNVAHPSVNILVAWLITATNLDEPDSMFRMVERAYAVDMARQVLDRLPQIQNDTRPARTNEQAACDLAYFFGTVTRENATASEQLYRLALRYDPRHAMANNNLGYALADTGVRLEEAHEMIRIAMAEQPGTGSVTDSLGWVRYKLGMLVDETDADGVVTEGAVTLLERASDMADAREDPIVHDHLGDAYWRLGRRDAAIERWTVASALLDTQLLRMGDDAPQEFLDIKATLGAKLDAVEAGQEPPVAPLGVGVTTTNVRIVNEPDEGDGVSS